MATLQGTLTCNRASLVEVVSNPNVIPRSVVGGTAGMVSSGGSAMMGKADVYTMDGSFRSYGNSNVRLILGSSTTRVETVAFRVLSPAQVQTLVDLMGHTVLYRDTYGRRIFGSYLSPQVMNIPFSNGLADVSLTFQAVTYNEAV